MSGKKRIIILLFALILTADTFAETDRYIRWQPVYGAGGYIIEIRDSRGRVIVDQEILSTSYDISRLEPGKYTYRITTLNKLKRRGGSTSWTGFTIEKAVIPEIRNVSRGLLAWSYENAAIKVTGSGFDSKTKIFLRNAAKNIETDVRFVSSAELEFEYNPRSEEAGIYDLVAVNDSGFEAVLKNAVEIKAPEIPVVEIADPDTKVAVSKETVTEKKETDSVKEKSPGSEGEIYLGLAWEYNLPLGRWADELSPSLAGLHIYFSYQLKGFSFFNSIAAFRNLDFEAKAGYSQFDLSSGTSDEYYRIMDALAGLNWSLPFSFFSNRLYPLIGINAGIAHSTVSVCNYTGSNVYSSFDPIVSAGLTFRYRQGAFFADASSAWQRVFYVSNPMDMAEISLRAGIIF